MTELQLFCGQSRQSVLAMSGSDCRAMFSSKAFASWKKSIELPIKQQNYVIERLDGLGKRLDSLAKQLSRRR